MRDSGGKMSDDHKYFVVHPKTMLLDIMRGRSISKTDPIVKYVSSKKDISAMVSDSLMKAVIDP